MFAGDIGTTLGLITAFFFTILILAYAFGDNPLFRLAVHIFIGVAAGYAGAAALKDVIIPRLYLLSDAEYIVVLVLILMLALKVAPKTAPIGNPVSGLLVGVGAALAIGGAIRGTLLPQVLGAAHIFKPDLMKEALSGNNLGAVIKLFFEGSVILIGTVTTLIHFHFSTKHVPGQIPERNKIIHVLSWIGQAFIAITFGVLFAGIFSAALTALVERLTFLTEFLITLL